MWPRLSAPRTDCCRESAELDGISPRHTHALGLRGARSGLRRGKEHFQRDACGLQPWAGGSEDLGAAFRVGSGEVLGKDSLHPRKG